MNPLIAARKEINTHLQGAYSIGKFSVNVCVCVCVCSYMCSFSHSVLRGVGYNIHHERGL